jgi:MFS family permease
MDTSKKIISLIDNADLRPIHWKIWFLSAMGIFLDGYDLFIIGVAMPIIIKVFGVRPGMVGAIGASAVVGAMAGALIGGFLTDRWGRKIIYIIDLLIFIMLSFCTAFAWSPLSLIIFRFILGIGIGADYPICASYVASFMPARVRGRMIIGAFSFQALGMLAAAVVGLLILKVLPHEEAWRWMLLSGVFPAIIVLYFRTGVPESARWCLKNGRHEKAAKVVSALVPEMEKEIHRMCQAAKNTANNIAGKSLGYADLFSKKFIKRTVLSAGAWFLMDIASYGVGLFTPLILGAMAYSGGGMDTISADFKATEGAVILDLFLVVGFALNIVLVEKWGRIKLQLLGFIGMATGLIILASSTFFRIGGMNNMSLIFIGFIMFNLLMNVGPNATTFILPAELFPTEIRATGHGFSAAAAKIGAATGIFMLPIIKSKYGITNTLLILSAMPLLGLALTYMFKIETKGRTLEEIELMG